MSIGRDRAVVITGASTGIGAACALHLDQLGFLVFAGVRKTQDGVELQQRVFGNFYILGFTDMGSVNAKPFGPWVRSAGPGVMWLSPVGALKLTVAKPFNSTNKKAWMIQFAMGPEL